MDGCRVRFVYAGSWSGNLVSYAEDKGTFERDMGRATTSNTELATTISTF